MDGKELKRIRRELGLSAARLGRALGYTGNKNTISVDIRRLEASRGRSIPITKARLAKMYSWHGVPEAWLGEED